MKTSLEWLSDFLPGPLTAEQAGEALTHGGLPVEVFERHGDDSVIDVEVTSNRGDCLSHLGVARELAALLDRPIHELPASTPKEISSPATANVAVSIEAPKLCPHYTARVIRNVRVGPSPAWMVRRLEAVGVRSINNVVDVTNYVMFELGQPLHAFDFDKVAGHRIVVREARAGETLVSIDQRERKLTPGMLVIADAHRPVALAGVMGGFESEVSASTTNVLLESARFEPLSVRKTARALAMKSDSSYRFERQIDPALPDRASLRAAQLILETAGGELLSGNVVAGSSGYSPKTLTLRLSRLKQILGIDFPADEVLGALKRLNLQPRMVDGGAAIEVVVPSYRLDLNIEVDLVEETARMLGYGRIPVRQEISIRAAALNPEETTLNRIRSLLIACGFFEALTFSFVSDSLATAFMPAEAKSLLRADPSVRAADARLRPSIVPGLLEAVRRNENAGTPGARLFETGSTFWLTEQGVDERRRVAMVAAGELRELRGAIELLLNRLNANRALQIVPDQRAGYARGACGRIEWGGQLAGYLGRIDRKISDQLGLRELPVAAELELSLLLAGTEHIPQQKPIPTFPAAHRDLSLVVAENVRYEQVESLLQSLRLPDLEDIQFVTTYRGKPLEKGTKSVTVTLIFRSPSGTLTSEQIDSRMQSAVNAAKEKLGAALRG